MFRSSKRAFPSLRRTIRRHILVALSLALLSFITSKVAYAQESASSGILGQVLDAAGSTVPEATVHVINVGTNAERVVTTNQQGEYSVPNMPPARYQIRVEKDGFQVVVVQAFELRVGEISRQSISLTLGSVQQTVEVTAESATLQTDTAMVSQVIEQKQITELPLNGRNLLQLAVLSAGAAPRSSLRNGINGAPATHYGERNEYITVEGGRDTDTNYVIDGVYVRSIRFNNLSLRPSVETVQEFNVLRNSFSTEYGQGGAAVTMVTRSGTNDVHGNVFEYLRNSVLDAKNFFATPGALIANGGNKPALRRNQFGATLGGPIVKNKVFLLGGYEGLRNTQERIVLGTSPTLAQLPRNLSTGADYNFAQAFPNAAPPIDPVTGVPFQGGIIPNSRISPFAKALVGTVPAPVPGLSTANSLGYVARFIDNYDTATFKSDQILSSKHTLFERYIWYDSTQFVPNTTSFGTDNFPQEGQNLSVGDTYIISPTTVNELHLGYNRAIASIGPLNRIPGQNWTTQAGIKNIGAITDPSLYGQPLFSLTGYGSFGDRQINQGAKENVYSISDSLGRVIGKHTIKFGIQLQQRRFDQQVEVPPRGQFAFTGQATNPTNRTIGAPGIGTGATVSASSSSAYSVVDFLLGICQSCQGSIGNSQSRYRDYTVGLFVNDVWQIHPRLTLNWGLRWEYLGPMAELNGNEGDFSPTTGKVGFHKVPANLPAVLLANNLLNLQDGYYPAGIVPRDLNNFAPRVGLAYRVSNKMVIRAGAGVYFDNPNYAELQFQRNLPPFYYNYGAPAFQFTSNLFPDVNSLTSVPGPWAVGENNRTPYTTEWNFNIQREVPGGIATEIAYSGSETHKEYKRMNLNQSLPVNPALNPYYFGPPGQQTIPYPQWQQTILASYNLVNANYHGLTAKADKRFAKGLSFIANFQWSKSIDDGSGEIEGNDNAVAVLPGLDRSLSRFHQKFRSTGSLIYELPLGKGKTYLKTGLGAAILGNWQVQTLISLYSGFYVTPTGPNTCACTTAYGVNRADIAKPGWGYLGDAATPNLWFDRTAFAVPAAGYQGNAGRSRIVAPGTQNVDFSLTKNISVGERINAQIRAEAFNVLNRPNLGIPNLDISSIAAGQITYTGGDNRSLQFGIKVGF